MKTQSVKDVFLYHDGWGGRKSLTKKKPPLPTGRLSGPRGPALQNIPLKTEMGRKIRDSFFKPSLGQPFSNFAEQEARTYELVKGEALVKQMLADLPTGARIVSQVHDEISIDFSQVSKEETLKYLAAAYLPDLPNYKDIKVDAELEDWPPLAKEDK